RQPESGIGGAEHRVERAEQGAERGLGEQRTERQQHERDHDGEAIERPATETTVPEPVPRADEREEDEARPGVERVGPPGRRPPNTRSASNAAGPKKSAVFADVW